MSEKLTVNLPVNMSEALLDQLLEEFFDEEQDNYNDDALNLFVVEAIVSALRTRAFIRAGVE